MIFDYGLRNWNSSWESTNNFRKFSILNFNKDPYGDNFEFDWDSYNIQCFQYNRLTNDYNTIRYLYNIINNGYYINRKKEKSMLINNVLENYGFSFLSSGTNRKVYFSSQNPDIVLKVAIDGEGVRANLREWKNQYYLQPFISKIFHCESNGLLMLEERVKAFKTFKEYANAFNEIFIILLHYQENMKYFLEDVGTNYFKNWGLRYEDFPVIVDFSEAFQYNPNKLKCTSKDKDTEEICGGDLEYDWKHGANFIICNKCGKSYYATELV